MKFKKLISGVLTLATLLTSIPLSSITSYAGFTNNAGGSGSSTASGNGLSSSGAKTLYSDTSGYRITQKLANF